MKIQKLRLRITTFILAFASSLWAQTPVTVTSTFTDKYGNVGNGEDKWSIENRGNTEVDWSNDYGLKFAKDKGPWVITCERYFTSISKVTIEGRQKSGTNVSVSLFPIINGTEYQGQEYELSWTNNRKSFDFTNLFQQDQHGHIGIYIGKPFGNIFYIKSISVTYTPTENEDTVTLNEANDNTSTLMSNMSTSKTVTVDLYRALTADMWNAICLPFSMSTPQQTALFGEGYKLKEFTSVDDEDGTSLKFTTVKGSTVAGKPYIVLPTQSVARNDKVSISGVAITNSTPGVTSVSGKQGTYTYEGIYAPTVLELNNQKIRFIGSGNKLYYPTTSNPMRAFRCFFTLPSDNAASNVTLNIDDDGVATAISATEVQGLFTSTNKVYTITGQYVGNNVPQEKGIYLIDGKKILVR